MAYLRVPLFLCFMVVAVSTSRGDRVRWEIADGGNGHWYEAVHVPEGLCWEEAQGLADAIGEEWHLATITSAAENAVIYSLVDGKPELWNCCVSGNAGGPWLGAFQVEPRVYEWVTGEPFEYTNWGPLEPFQGYDYVALFGYHASQGDQWNDVPDCYPPGPPFGYIAERPGTCQADLDGDDSVGVTDLTAVLAAWHNKGGPEDLNGSGVVGFDDLVVLLGSWGSC